MKNQTSPLYFTLFFMFWQFVLVAQTTVTGLDSSTDTLVVQDQGWPRTIELDEAILTFHQPQIFRWDNFTEMGGWVAVEIDPRDEHKPSLVGAAKVKAKTETDLDSRSVLIYDKELEEVNFEGIDSAFEKKIEERFRSLQNSPEVISLDRMIPMVDESVFDFQGVATNTQPPVIFYSDDPNSLLVILDGKPVWTPTGVKNLQFAVNTNWPLFRHEKKESIYLLNETTWLKAEKVTSPIRKADKLPKEFKKLTKEEGWEDLSKAIPLVENEGPDPIVFVSDKPAELLLLLGPPKFKDIEGAGGLKSVYNTEADLFFDSTNDQYYFLVSGRWFRSSSLNGPWTFATTDLPETFANIPEESEWGHVLSSVPGTLQTKEAAIQTMIPQTAQLSRDAQPPKVTYDGEPKFKQIDDSKVSYATNSQYDVIHYDDKYYLCYQGAWFVSSYPTHGWSVCTYIPPPIYAIPPTCPVYHVSYVHCYGYTSSYATYGYTSGYMGIHLSYGVPFYGTGYYYSPYYYHYPYGYPMYYGYPYSYGFRATYNPYTGTYGRQARVYGPYGGAGRGAYYNPSTGALCQRPFSLGSLWWSGRSCGLQSENGNQGLWPNRSGI